MIRDRVRALKVLLVSPVDPEVPGDLKYLMGGESTYTKSLLKNSPTGVTYVHYRQALKEGSVEYLPLHAILRFLVKIRFLPLSGGSQCLEIKGDFDLVHCHGYSLKISGKNIPVILSDSSSNYLFLRDYVNWPIWRIKLGYWLRGWLFDLLGVVDADTNPNAAKKIVVFSKFAHKLHRDLGVPKEELEVVYAGLPSSVIPAKAGIQKQSWIPHQVRDDKVNILFVGTWFERKGGHLLLEAFERVSARYPNVRLTIVGEVPEKYAPYSSSEGATATESRSKSGSSRLHSNNIRQHNYVPRERLMGEFFPKADIFVLVPPKVEGYGFVVVEAMSFGIPVIVSEACALPELVENGKIGFVIKQGSVDELVQKLEVLIRNKLTRKKMGDTARKSFEEKFSIEKSNEQLLKVYLQALS